MIDSPQGGWLSSPISLCLAYSHTAPISWGDLRVEASVVITIYDRIPSLPQKIWLTYFSFSKWREQVQTAFAAFVQKATVKF